MLLLLSVSRTNYPEDVMTRVMLFENTHFNTTDPIDSEEEEKLTTWQNIRFSLFEREKLIKTIKGKEREKIITGRVNTDLFHILLDH